MFKIFKQFKKVSTQGKEKIVSTATELQDSRKVILSLIFAMATILKITPKTLAAEFSKKRAKEYATKVNAELDKIQEKAMTKLREAINKPIKKTK